MRTWKTLTPCSVTQIKLVQREKQNKHSELLPARRRDDVCTKMSPMFITSAIFFSHYFLSSPCGNSHHSILNKFNGFLLIVMLLVLAVQQTFERLNLFLFQKMTCQSREICVQSVCVHVYSLVYRCTVCQCTLQPLDGKSFGLSE